MTLVRKKALTKQLQLRLRVVMSDYSEMQLQLNSNEILTIVPNCEIMTLKDLAQSSDRQDSVELQNTFKTSKIAGFCWFIIQSGELAPQQKLYNGIV